MNSKEMTEILIKAGDPEKAKGALRFFKTGKGEYGEGDKFLGIKSADIAGLVKTYAKGLSLVDVEALLKSEWHEARTFALLIMKKRMKKEGDAVYEIFIRNVERINNWDLVDVFAPYITGCRWYNSGDYGKLWEFARSGNLWKERIAVLSSFYNIRQKETSLTLELCRHFLSHTHDLMHKAVGWALREVGKIDQNALLTFLDEYAAVMPRTMLRYCLERQTPDKRKYYMSSRANGRTGQSPKIVC
jgi:3-methyladenine DNA glycosylase AlkD